MHRRPHGTCLLAAVLLTVTVVTPAAADSKGRAYACYASLPSYGITPMTQCDSGWQDRRASGSRSTQQSNLSYGNVLHIDYMESESDGDKCKGKNRNKLGAGWILKGSPAEVTWQHMESDDDDACCKRQKGDDLRSTIVGLTFGGQPVTITGQPNQALTIPGQGTLILNELKHDSDDECDDDDEHLALHLILKNGNEVILAGAKHHSDDHCCSTTPTLSSSWGAVKAYYR
jgi:hypothetical protein